MKSNVRTTILSIALILTALTSIPRLAIANGSTHLIGGGDRIALEFKSIAYRMTDALYRLRFAPPAVDIATFAKKVKTMDPRSVERALMLPTADGLSKKEVDAINYADSGIIEINIARWDLMKPLAKASLVYHEILGLMLLDRPEYNFSRAVIEQPLILTHIFGHGYCPVTEEEKLLASLESLASSPGSLEEAEAKIPTIVDITRTCTSLQVNVFAIGIISNLMHEYSSLIPNAVRAITNICEPSDQGCIAEALTRLAALTDRSKTNQTKYAIESMNSLVIDANSRLIARHAVKALSESPQKCHATENTSTETYAICKRAWSNWQGMSYLNGVGQ